MNISGSALGFAKGKPTERWRRKVSGLMSLGSMTAGPPKSRPSTGRLRRHSNGWKESSHACVRFERGEPAFWGGVPRSGLPIQAT